MCQKDLVKGKDVDCTITAARNKHEVIVHRLMERPGDSEGAMYRAESIFGLSYWRQWNLRHKRRATNDFIAQVHDAYTAMLQRSVEREIKLLKIDQAVEKAKGNANADLENLEAKAHALLAEIKAAREG